MSIAPIHHREKIQHPITKPKGPQPSGNPPKEDTKENPLHHRRDKDKEEQQPYDPGIDYQA